MNTDTLHRRRRLCQGMALWPALALSPFAWSAAPAWRPQRPVQMIVPWPAGGGTDLALRILAEEASPLLGQPVVVVNRPGAAGTMVAPLLKAAAPDGHTIGQLPITVLRYALMNRVDWDPMTDLRPLLQVSSTTFGLLVPASSPWQSVSALLDWARAHPGELLLGSTGVGSSPHLAMEELLSGQGIRYVHVPYKGTADQMLALVSGQIMAGMNSTGFGPWVDQGKLRLLAVFAEQRMARWPQVPTMRELGFAQAVYRSPWGLVAPAGVSAEAAQVLEQAFTQALASPRFHTELARYDQQVDHLASADYRASLQRTQQNERALLQRMQLLAGDR